MTTIALSTEQADLVRNVHSDFEDALPAHRYRSELDTTLLSNDALSALTEALAEDAEAAAALRAVKAVLRVRETGDSPVYSLPAAPALIAAWVDLHCERGWVVSGQATDRPQWWLVTDVALHEPRASQGDNPFVAVALASSAPGGASDGRKKNSVQQGTISISSEDLLGQAQPGGKRKRRTVAQLFEALGYFPATAEDVEAHDQVSDEYEEILQTGFASQYRHTGVLSPTEGWQSWETQRAKVIHDVAPADIPPVKSHAMVWRKDDTATQRELPTRPCLRVFDLAVQKFAIADSRDLTPYQYDPSLRDKLILPETHRELLDVLTTDLAEYSQDIVEGKSAGNVILSRGRPGVGKTLTAEVYSEIVQKPLYAIHSGSLGTSATSVRENLQATFQRAQRWDAILLLDEADVFVRERGSSVEQNAIVAEFLRTLEYFTGLLFMTTNRVSEIDDAILSRCAAVISYQTPPPADAKRVWQVMVANSDAEALVSEQMIDRLVETYPSLAPRDIKMVLRLALRIASRRDEAPSMEVFQRCILFRGLTASDEEAPA